MKPFVERITRDSHIDWLVRRFHCRHSNFEWHYHLEYELVLALDCEGEWFVGGHTGPYQHGSSMLIAPHLPHTSIITNLPDDVTPTTYVLWFSHEWVCQLTNTFAEFRPLMEVLSDSGKGVGFTPETGLALKREFEAIDHSASKSQQLIHLLQIFSILIEAPERQTFNTVNVCAAPTDDLSKASKITRFIEQRYDHAIAIADLARHLNTSESSVRRLFQKHFNESFSEHLKQYRIGKACELLINTELPVSLVAEKTGFNNLSNFNRQFTQIKQQTPRSFRNQYAAAA